MNWLMRNWISVFMLTLCTGLTLCAVIVEMRVPLASLAVLSMAGICLGLGVLSRFVPLDMGSYTPKLRDHALVAYRLWRGTQRMSLGQAKYENERLAFEMVDWLFANIVWKRRLYVEMTEEEQLFWCAYVEYRLHGDDAALTHDGGLRNLCAFLKENRTTPEQRERVELRMVLAPNERELSR